jgi:DNA-binding NarL/FixJ family response regulator
MDEIAQAHIAELSDDQCRLLRLLAAGATTAELGVRLGLSPTRARRAVDGLLAALGVEDAAGATVLWWGSRAGARADLRAAALASSRRQPTRAA